MEKCVRGCRGQAVAGAADALEMQKERSSRGGRPFKVGESRVAIRILASTQHMMVRACGYNQVLQTFDGAP